MVDTAALKRGLRTEIERSLAGEAGASVVLLLREGSLPMAAITDAHGTVHKKVLSFVDLLAALDGSSVVDQLEKEATRTLSVPPLPPHTLLLALLERPSGFTYVLTGFVRPRVHLFVLEHAGHTTTHELPLPHLVWRAVWEERTRSLSSLSLALCSPHLDGGEPTAATRLYRWPFSNVYDRFGGAMQGVCWPTMRQLTLDLPEIPERAVLGFVGIPNNADLYGRGLSHNAPHSGYREFLEAIEERGGIDHDWLIPADLTVRQLHEQRRR
ncbi:MAG: hypothetical protein AB1425_00900 [Actinomycetota bacterium]